MRHDKAKMKQKKEPARPAEGGQPGRSAPASGGKGDAPGTRQDEAGGPKKK
jgi:hypothetical protein